MNLEEPDKQAPPVLVTPEQSPEHSTRNKLKTQEGICNAINETYPDLFSPEQLEQIYAIASQIRRNAESEQVKITEDVQHDNFERDEEITVLKSLMSITDKVVYTILEFVAKPVDEAKTVDEAISEVQRNPSKYIRDAVRLYFSMVEPEEDLKNATNHFLKELRKKGYHYEEPVKDATQSLGRGFLVKATTPSGYAFELQLFTQSGMNLYKTDRSHDVYKNMQRELGQLRYHIIKNHEPEIIMNSYTKITEFFEQAREILDRNPNKGAPYDTKQLFQTKPHYAMSGMETDIKLLMIKLGFIKEGGRRTKRRKTKRKRTTRRKRTIYRRRNIQRI